VTRINIMSQVRIQGKMFGLTLLFLKEFGLNIIEICDLNYTSRTL